MNPISRTAAAYTAFAVVLAVGLPIATRGQGALAPPGPPQPTMHSLEEVYQGVATASRNSVLLTNAMGQMDWQDILNIESALAVCTQDVSRMASALGNIAVDWSVIGHCCQVITNALGPVNWSDVILIRGSSAQTLAVAQKTDTNVCYLTNLLAAVDWPAISSATSNVALLVASFTNVAWDLQTINERLGDVTNRMAAADAKLDAIWSVVQENNVLLHSLTNSP